MRLGINYDTGFAPGGTDSRPDFDAARVPFELDEPATLAVLLDSADRAEALRGTGAEVTLVLGCELSLFAPGFLAGRDVYERIRGLRAGGVEADTVRARLDAFLAAAAGGVRQRFGGRVTYASGVWEDVDWATFDVVGVDAYRDAGNEADYAADLSRRVRCADAVGKAVAVTEYGSCTAPVLRDEAEQACYLRECVRSMEQTGVAIAFWFTFASFGADGSDAADAAGYGLMRVHPDATLTRKAAAAEFARLALRPRG